MFRSYLDWLSKHADKAVASPLRAVLVFVLIGVIAIGFLAFIAKAFGSSLFAFFYVSLNISFLLTIFPIFGLFIFKKLEQMGQSSQK
jgi:hypothetical protein